MTTRSVRCDRGRSGTKLGSTSNKMSPSAYRFVTLQPTPLALVHRMPTGDLQARRGDIRLGEQLQVARINSPEPLQINPL